MAASRGTGSVKIVSFLFEYRTFFDITHSILSSTFMSRGRQTVRQMKVTSQHTPGIWSCLLGWKDQQSCVETCQWLSKDEDKTLEHPTMRRWCIFQTEQLCWSQDTKRNVTLIHTYIPAASLCWTRHVHDQSEPWTYLEEFPFAPTIIKSYQIMSVVNYGEKRNYLWSLVFCFSLTLSFPCHFLGRWGLWVSPRQQACTQLTPIHTRRHAHTKTR